MPELIELECSGNELTALDVSQNPALELLRCKENLFASQDDVIGIESIATVEFEPQRTA
jgi:hypothetical protein